MTWKYTTAAQKNKFFKGPKGKICFIMWLKWNLLLNLIFSWLLVVGKFEKLKNDHLSSGMDHFRSWLMQYFQMFPKH